MEERGLQRSPHSSDPPSSVLASAPAQLNGEASRKELTADFNLMLRGLLHELRNPLSSILTAANLVDDTARASNEVSEETSMLLGVIKKESLRLNRILTEFSNFIKLPEPQPSHIDLVQLTRDVAAQLKDENVIANGVEIVDELPDECLVWADQNQIRTALNHLLRNSGEAMPETGKLHLSLRETEKSAAICLADSGKGFSEESKARAFQPFYSTKVHSTGLGLSTARAIIELAGGRIWIENNSPTTNQSTPGDSQSTPAMENATSDSSARLCIELPRERSDSQVESQGAGQEIKSEYVFDEASFNSQGVR